MGVLLPLPAWERSHSTSKTGVNALMARSATAGEGSSDDREGEPPSPGFRAARAIRTSPRRGEVKPLFHRLDAHPPAPPIDLPDRHRGGRVVDPGLAVDAVGLGQHVFGEAHGLRVEAQVAARMHFAGPYLAVLIGLRRIHG